MAVRLFIGNLPYGATEADLRAHFAPVAAPSHVVMPVDRETGRPRGFAFVEFTDRTARPTKSSGNSTPSPSRGATWRSAKRARARTGRRRRVLRAAALVARGPAGSAVRGRAAASAAAASRPRPPGGGFPPGPGGRDRSANFGPPAPPKRLRGAKKSSQQEHKPHGPIKEKGGGRIYAVDDLEDDTSIDIDNVATQRACRRDRRAGSPGRREPGRRARRSGLGESFGSASRLAGGRRHRRPALRRHPLLHRPRRDGRQRAPARSRLSR